MSEISKQDLSLLEKFKAKADEFMQAFANLTSYQVLPGSPMYDEHQSLISRGQTIRNTIQGITTAVDKATGFFSNLFNFNGVPVVQGYINHSSGQLGVVPLIPIAGITAALAYMGSWIADVYLFERRLAESKRLESKGIPPAEAANIATQSVKKPMFAGVADIVKPAGIATGLYFLFRFLNGVRNNGR